MPWHALDRLLGVMLGGGGLSKAGGGVVSEADGVGSLNETINNIIKLINECEGRTSGRFAFSKTYKSGPEPRLLIYSGLWDNSISLDNVTYEGLLLKRHITYNRLIDFIDKQSLLDNPHLTPDNVKLLRMSFRTWFIDDFCNETKIDVADWEWLLDRIGYGVFCNVQSAASESIQVTMWLHPRLVSRLTTLLSN